MAEKIIIFGVGKITDCLYYYLSRDTDYEICAFCVDKEYIEEQEYHGLPVVAFDDIETLYPVADYKIAISIGYQKINKIREAKYNQAKEKGYSFISYISSKAVCDGTIGENTFIFDGTIVNPSVEIGNNVFIWSGSHIGHHSKIKDHCFISSSRTAGCILIEENCFVGVGATICDTLTVGHHSIIGGGMVISKNIKPNSVMAMKQAKPLELKSYEMEDILG